MQEQSRSRSKTRARVVCVRARAEQVEGEVCATLYRGEKQMVWVKGAGSCAGVPRAQVASNQ